jgi:WG containing repeat
MYPRRDDTSGRYGYWGRDGWAIRPQFGYAHRFLRGYAAVNLVDGSCGLIGRDGAFLPPDSICGGRTPVQQEYPSFTFTGFVDLESEPSRYAAVCTMDRGRRQWGLIDTTLAYRPLPDDVFRVATDVRPYGEYIVIVRTSDRVGESFCGLFNLGEMRLELPIDYACIYPSRESLWVVARARTARDDHQARRFAFYDPRKRELLPGWFWGALPFSCGLGAIREEDGGSYFVDEDLRPAFDARFDYVSRFSCGLAAVYKDADAGYIDTKGKMHLLLPYDDLQPFNEFGLAIANRDELNWNIDIIDREGRPQLSGLETAVFWEGDFPYFEVTKGGIDHLYDINLNLIF